MSAQSEEKTFSINYPWVFAQTRMYPLNAVDPRMAFVLGEVRIPMSHPFPFHVGFCRSCVEVWEMRAPWDKDGTVVCPYTSHEQHGHLILVCDDGTAIMQTPIQSRPMLEFVFRLLAEHGTLSREEADTALLVLKESVKDLYTEMTKTEQMFVTMKEVENEVENLVWIS